MALNGESRPAGTGRLSELVAVATANGSENGNSQRSKQRHSRDAEVHHLSVYDGARQIGRIVQRGRECTAFSWPADINIGEYNNRRAAADAISAADVVSRGERLVGEAA